MKKRALCALMALCLLLALLPMTALAEGETIKEASNEKELRDALTNESYSTVKMTADININGAIQTNRSVTLDLNGCVLRQMVKNERVIRVDGGSTLTLKDSQPDATHDGLPSGGVITGGDVSSWNIDGGAVFVSSGCTFIMDGGNIVGCRAENGGGVYLWGNASFIMNGGNIVQCWAKNNGGGVYVSGGATFTLNDGTISCSAWLGSADNVAADGTFTDNTKCTVTFDSNGGSAVDSQVVQKGGTITRPNNPTKYGYTFAGWYNGETLWKFETDTATASMTLTAKWTPIPAAPVEEPSAPWWFLLPALEQTAELPFYDVDSNDWFYEAVKSVWEQELIDGVTARYYMPENTLTVAQAVKLAAALHQKQSVGFVTLQNGGTHWYDNYVNYAVANGLVEAAYQNKSAETMNAPVTRAEFVHILSKLLHAGAVNTVNSIPDVKDGDAYAEEIFAFYRAGILTGSDRLGTFHPTSSLKRSEAAAILVRLYDASQRQYITLR